MNVLDLFSGIGGFSLGLERAGMRTVAFCEIDPYCQRVLRKHWPDVPIYGDIRELTAARLVADANGTERKSPGNGFANEASDATRKCDVDVICGGFPCQDISVAGKGAGIGGERSGLWSEYARIIGEVRPRYVIVENVAALLGRGLATVLGDLAALGFDAEWHCIPASAIGAPHRRDRLWIIAHASSSELRDEPRRRNGTSWPDPSKPGDDGAEEPVAYAASARSQGFGENGTTPRSAGLCSGAWGNQEQDISDAGRFAAERWQFDLGAIGERDWWRAEPDVGRVAHGVPARVDRLRALGNAVVPQIPELIGRAIMSSERDDYDGDDDFAKSYTECLRVIRERKAAGGKGWTPP